MRSNGRRIQVREVVVVHRERLFRLIDQIRRKPEQDTRLGILEARPRNRHVVRAALHVELNQRVFLEGAMIHPHMVRTVMDRKRTAGTRVEHRNSGSGKREVLENQVGRDIGEHAHARNADVATAAVDGFVFLEAERGLQVVRSALLEQHPRGAILIGALAQRTRSDYRRRDSIASRIDFRRILDNDVIFRRGHDADFAFSLFDIPETIRLACGTKRSNRIAFEFRK